MLSGSIVALITPWTEDGSQVDKAALKKLIDWHIEQGTDAILPCGTTGESPSFTHEEQHDMIASTVEFVAGRVPVLAGAGSNNTREAVSLAQNAERLGADAVLTITPYYNKPPQEGLYQHFKAVREACGLPLMLYNVPSRTGINLLPETAARVAELGNIIGVKEASGSLSQAQDLLDAGVDVYSGEDGINWPLMSIGARGAVSVVANFAPKLMSELCAAAQAGNVPEAQRLHKIIHDLTKVAFCETNPLPAKTAVAEILKISDHLRLPLVPISAAGKERVVAALKKYDLI